jgi:hypothetical protein
MASFQDKNNKNWQINVTMLDVKRLRENQSIKLTDPETLSELFNDECMIFDVLWVLCEPQADGMTADEFAKILMPCYVPAVEALIKALTDFFQQCGRIELAKLIERTLNASKRLQKLTEENLSSTSMDQMIDQMIEREDKRMKEAMTNTSLSGD